MAGRRVCLLAPALAAALSLTTTSCTLLNRISYALGAVCSGPLVVSTTTDKNDGICTAEDCSLREAVITANGCPGVQTIEVPAGTYLLTLAGAGEAQAGSGDLNLLAGVSIQATGGPAIIDGNGLDRVFHIGSGIPASEPVVLQGLTIQGGRLNGPGAGLFQAGESHLLLIDVTVSGNQAGSPSAPGSGGGVFTNGALSFMGVVLEGNVAYGEGGGLFINSNGDVNVLGDLSILGNEARGGYSGGGVFNRGYARLSGRIEGNTSEWVGGGVRNNGLFEASNLVVTGNQAENGGGGIANSGRMRMSESQVSGNQAPIGGGLLQFSVPSFGEIARAYIDTGAIVNNQAAQSGGGVFNSGGSLLVLNAMTVANNQAAVSGGGIYTQGESTILYSSISGNSALGVGGGGILNAGLMRLERSLVAANQAPGTDPAGGSYAGGSGLTVRDGGYANVWNSTFSGNQITNGEGAVIDNFFATIDLDYVTIADNPGYAFGGPLDSMPAIQLFRTIIVRNNGAGTQCSSPVATIGWNLLADDTCGQDPYDLVLEPSDDPGLAPLGNYGGPTMTHSLLPGSPAINAASDLCTGGLDQRGTSRPQGASCDIGAYERVFQLPPTVGDISDLVLEVAPVEPTGCYFGPASIYSLVTTVEAGEPLEARFRNAEATWVQVVSRTRVFDPCWIVLELLELADAPPVEELPEAEPPFTPTPSAAIEINFNADSYSLQVGQCTRLRWEVVNASQVFLDGEPVPPLEAEQVCPAATTTYRLRAENETQSQEAIVTIQVSASAPPAPGGLSHQRVCELAGFQVILDWDDVADNEEGYRVYRDGALIATLGANANSYNDMPFFGGPYTYGVEAYNEVGASSRPTTTVDACFVIE